VHGSHAARVTSIFPSSLAGRRHFCCLVNRLYTNATSRGVQYYKISPTLLLRTFVERKIRIKYTKCAKSAGKQKCLQSGFVLITSSEMSGDRSSDSWSIDGKTSLPVVSLCARKVELARRGGSQMGPTRAGGRMMLVCIVLPGMMEPSRECTFTMTAVLNLILCNQVREHSMSY